MNFIAQSLIAVMRGAEQAQLELADTAAIVNPEATVATIALEAGKSPPKLGEIEFVVSVNTSKENGANRLLRVSVPLSNLMVGHQQTHE